MKKQKKLDIKETQFRWFIFGIGLVFLILAGSYIYAQSLKHFEYAGMSFVIEDYQGLTIYHGVFPVIINKTKIYDDNIYMRNDPRKNNVSVNTSFFQLSTKVYIGLDQPSSLCNLASVAQVELIKFVKLFPWVKNISTGAIGANFSKEMNITEVSCKTASNGTVLLVQKANESSIVQLSDNCFALNVADCDNVKVVERYITAAIAQVNNKEL